MVAIEAIGKRWREAPWACPQCQGEIVMVRDVKLPGGEPTDVRRVATVTWQSRCMSCGIMWRNTFVPRSFEFLPVPSKEPH